jgi:hypothetical protein
MKNVRKEYENHGAKTAVISISAGAGRIWFNVIYAFRWIL